MPKFGHLGSKYLKTNVKFEISSFEIGYLRNFVKIRRSILVSPKCPNLGILARNFRKQMANLKSAYLKKVHAKFRLSQYFLAEKAQLWVFGLKIWKFGSFRMVSARFGSFRVLVSTFSRLVFHNFRMKVFHYQKTLYNCFCVFALLCFTKNICIGFIFLFLLICFGDRSSHHRCSVKEMLLKISLISQESTCLGVCF